MGKIGVVAGKGGLPRTIISSLKASKQDYYVLGFRGITDIGLPCNEVINLGQLGRAFELLKENGATDLVFAGYFRRPRLFDLRPDAKGIIIAAKIGLHLTGDDRLMTALMKEVEKEGFRIVAVDELLPDIKAYKGVYGGKRPSDTDMTDIKAGFKLAKEVGRLDIGQAVVIKEGEVLGVEAAEGTDALIKRSGELKNGSGGVLVKVKKPMQTRKMDLPVIGLETLAALKNAGLAGVAVEVGNVLLLDHENLAAAADDYGVFIIGVEENALLEK